MMSLAFYRLCQVRLYRCELVQRRLQVLDDLRGDDVRVFQVRGIL